MIKLIRDLWLMFGAYLLIIFLFAMLLGLFTGCAMFGGSDKPKRAFPAWATDQCYGALNAARDAIQSKGTRLSDKSIRVHVIPGQRKFGSLWAWYVEEETWPDGGMWIGGLTSGDGRLIQIVIDPNRATDPAALHMGSLIHEMGHHWLIRNGHGSGHPAIYDDVLPGWASARRIFEK